MKMINIIYSGLFLILLGGCENKVSKTDSPDINIDPNSRMGVDLVGKNRYQLATNPTTILDTQTGEVWRATGPVGGPYYFVRICYKDSNLNELSPLPNNIMTKEDLKSYQKDCSSK